MSETWTEYAVRAKSPGYENVHDVYCYPTKAAAERNVYRFDGGVVVGRTVTASDWLPVDTDGAK